MDTTAQQDNFTISLKLNKPTELFFDVDRPPTLLLDSDSPVLRFAVATSHSNAISFTTRDRGGYASTITTQARLLYKRLRAAKWSFQQPYFLLHREGGFLVPTHYEGAKPQNYQPWMRLDIKQLDRQDNTLPLGINPDGEDARFMERVISACSLVVQSRGSTGRMSRQVRDAHLTMKAFHALVDQVKAMEDVC